MVNDFFLFHHEKAHKNAKSFEIEPQTSVKFETCLRKIHLSKYIPTDFQDLNMLNSSTQKSSWDLLEGEQAYSFLIEVLAGLHSPMVGETEVLGQFKNQIQLQKEVANFFSPWLSWVFEDIKKVRTQFLQNTGTQTYGSWVRTLIPRERPLLILGAGQLCEKIFPYVQSIEHPIGIVTRNKSKVKELLLNFSLNYEDNISDFIMTKKRNENGILNQTIVKNHFFEVDIIVAAPIANEKLQTWISSQNLSINNYLDLRAEHEPIKNLNQKGFVIGLQEFFKLQEKQKINLQKRKIEAQQFIQQLARSRFEYCFHRPWGWDDVCSL